MTIEQRLEALENGIAINMPAQQRASLCALVSGCTGKYFSAYNSFPGAIGSGPQTYTVGFKPKFVRITATSNGNNGGLSWGSAYQKADGTFGNSFVGLVNTFGTLSPISSQTLITSITLSPNTMTGAVTSFTDTGVTINWTSPGNFFSIEFNLEAFG